MYTISSNTGRPISGSLITPGIYSLRVDGTWLLVNDTSQPEYLGALKLNFIYLDGAGGSGGGGAGDDGEDSGAGGGGARTIILDTVLPGGVVWEIVVGLGSPGGMGGVHSAGGSDGLDGEDTIFRRRTSDLIYIAGGGKKGNGGYSRYWTDRGYYRGYGGLGGVGTIPGLAGQYHGNGGNSGANALGGIFGNPGNPGIFPGAGGSGTVSGNVTGAQGGTGANGQFIYDILLL